MSNQDKIFSAEVQRNMSSLGGDSVFKNLTLQQHNQSAIHKYSYNFRVLGRPIIQYPQDMVAMQELIWSVKPDIIIETGIAHGLAENERVHAGFTGYVRGHRERDCARSQEIQAQSVGLRYRYSPAQPRGD